MVDRLPTKIMCDQEEPYAIVPSRLNEDAVNRIVLYLHQNNDQAKVWPQYVSAEILFFICLFRQDMSGSQSLKQFTRNDVTEIIVSGKQGETFRVYELTIESHWDAACTAFMQHPEK